MRVTDLSIERNFLYNIFQSESKLGKLQNQAYSGQAILRPQDDPIGAGRSISLRHSLSIGRQYARNIDKARNWMEQTEETLNHLTKVFSRAHELALYGSTGTTPPAAREAIAAEVRQLKEEADTILATTVDNRALLAGTMPEWRLADDVVIAAKSLDGLEEIVDLLDRLAQGLESGEGDIQFMTDDLDKGLNKVLAERAENGAKLRRLDILDDKAVNLDMENQRLLSNVEDIDLAQILVRLKSQEAAYQAALAAGARLIQPSLLDHLR